MHPAGGFTLLELLIATAVGAVVLLVIQTTYFGALRLHNTTHERIDEDLTLERTLAIVRRDLSGLMLPGGTLSGQFQTENFSSITTEDYGERISPDLYTNAGRIDGWNQFSDVQMVAYYLAPSEHSTTAAKNLVRVVTRNLLPAQEPLPEEQVLLEGVEAASVMFYDGAEWIESWDSTVTSTLPKALRFTLILAARENEQRTATTSTAAPIELVVPVLVKTTTSQREEEAEAAGADAP